MTEYKTKVKKKQLIRQKYKLFRAKEPLFSVFMWGINHSVNELAQVNAPVMLMPDDFKAYSKVRMDNHLFNKENMPSHFKFKEYCPTVFRNLRDRFGIDEEVYQYVDEAGILTLSRSGSYDPDRSLSSSAPTETTSPGRSNARFLTSFNKRFVIKTINADEVAKMHDILKDYHQHIVEREANTLLPQYVGMYRITVYDTETYAVVMRNIFSGRLEIHKKYDLKGSTVSREASNKEKAKELPTFKDIDFMKDESSIRIGTEGKARFLAMLSADLEFLQKQNLMDYSMLVGIHDMERALEESEVEENGVEEEDSGSGAEDSSGSDDGFARCGTPPDSPLASPLCSPWNGQLDQTIERFAIKAEGKNLIYFLGIIDVLTQFGMKKRTAAAVKTVKYGAGSEISTVKPEQYARRFQEFMDKVLV